MTTSQIPDGASPTPTTPQAKSSRALLGASLGGIVGGLVGWLIDSAVTADPYGGVRIGSFVGVLGGAVVATGAGWRGVGMVLAIVLCSGVGAVLGIALWNPGANDFLSLVPAMSGGVVGAFVGLGLAVALIRRREPGNPTNNSGAPVK